MISLEQGGEICMNTSTAHPHQNAPIYQGVELNCLTTISPFSAQCCSNLQLPSGGGASGWSSTDTTKNHSRLRTTILLPLLQRKSGTSSITAQEISHTLSLHKPKTARAEHFQEFLWLQISRHGNNLQFLLKPTILPEIRSA